MYEFLRQNISPKNILNDLIFECFQKIGQLQRIWIFTPKLVGDFYVVFGAKIQIAIHFQNYLKLALIFRFNISF